MQAESLTNGELDALVEEFDAETEPPVVDAHAVERLAGLSPFEYDRAREAEARRLGVRVGTLDAEVRRLRGDADPDAGGTATLDDIEPWPDPVDGAVLLGGLVDALHRHMVLPDGAAVLTALWILHSHAHDTALISPILAITSPTPECGKTTLLTVLLSTTARPLPASNITSAALFRAVEKWSPTLLVDEADTFLKDSDELRGVLNSGHNRATAFVIRTVGEDHDPRRFRTWSPKAIALIGKLPATLESRAVHVELRRLGVGERVEPLRGDRLQHLVPLARKAARWGADNAVALRAAEPDVPDFLRGRAADNWRNLLAIADVAGGDWPRQAREAARKLSGGRSEQTVGVTLLADLRRLFEDKRADRLPSADIVESLGAMEDRPWPEWRGGKPITTRGLAKLLDPFGIAPTTIRTYTNVSKGYHRASFNDAFARYLPNLSVTTLQPLENLHSGEFLSVTPDPLVTDRNSEKPKQTGTCNGVTDRKGENRESGGVGPRCDHCGEGDRPNDPVLESSIDGESKRLHWGCTGGER